jgi:hypothetical protein
MTTVQPIPSEYSAFFWDVHINDLNFSIHRRFIIERLLNEGGFAMK